MFLFRNNFWLNPNLNPQIAVAAIGAGASVAGGIVSGIGSSKAAGAQAAAAQQAYQGEQNYMNQNTQNYQPYMTAGSSAIGQISSDLQNGTGFAQSFTPQNYINTPGYQFQQQQGTNAINSSSAATGGVLNGGTLKALDQYTTGLANSTYSQAYQNYLAGSQQQYNQLYGVANLGESATTSLGAQNGAAQTAAGNDLIGKGNAQAAGDVGISNAINQGISGLGNAAQLGYLGSQSGYGSSNNLATSTGNQLQQMVSNYGGDPAPGGG